MSEAGSVPSIDDVELFSPAFIEDPYPVYAELRARGPVLRTPFSFWLATRHREISQLLRDRRFGKDFERRTRSRYGDAALEEPALRSLSRMMLVLDPPDHTRIRGLANKAFTTPRIEALRPRIERIANELIDEVEGRGHMDLIWDFAHKLPVQVICEMLGIPDSDRPRFLGGSQVSGRLIDPTPLSREELDEANRRTLDSEVYFRGLFDLRRAQPGEDLTTHLVQAEEAGDKLSEEELVHNVILLFAAGHETTANLIGNGMLALHRNPAALATVRSGEVSWPDVVEELLRYDSSVQLTSRTAREGAELGGVEIPAGELVIGLLGSANRDPEAYPDPDTLDVTRTNFRAMSFGGGIHTCLGARLARLEGEVAFRTLFERLPHLELPEKERPRWRQTFTLRALETLPAAW